MPARQNQPRNDLDARPNRFLLTRVRAVLVDSVSARQAGTPQDIKAIADPFKAAIPEQGNRARATIQARMALEREKPVLGQMGEEALFRICPLFL